MNARHPGNHAVHDDEPSLATVRVFYSLVPDEEVRSSLVALSRDVARRSRGRAVSGEHIHLTMAFLGDVAPSVLPVLQDVGDSIEHLGATLDFEVLGAWRASGVAWVAPATVPQPLLTLHATLGAALTGAGFTLEARAFRPHITLARRCVAPLPRSRCPRIRWRVDRLRLVTSELRPEGPVYRDVATWPLAVGR